MTEPHSLVRRVADARLRRPDDRRAAGPADPARAHHRDRRRERVRQVDPAARARPPHHAALRARSCSTARRCTAARRRRSRARSACCRRAPIAPEGIAVADLVGRGRHPHQKLLARWSRHDYEVVAQSLDATGIADLADRSVDELSGGQRQRVWIAMALAQETDILLLDEPTTFLDVAHQVEVLDLLTDLNRDRGTTIVMVLHDMNLAARYADHMFALRDGRLVAGGPPREVMTSELIRDVFDLDALVIPDPVSGTPIVLPRGRHHVRHPPKRLPSPNRSRQEPRWPAAASTIRFFRAPVTAITDLTPSFRRFTFGGDDLADYGDPGFDQRIKVVFPTATIGLDAMPAGDDWYTRVARDARGRATAVPDVHDAPGPQRRARGRHRHGRARRARARRPRGSPAPPSATRC